MSDEILETGERLSPKQSQAIVAILSNPTIEKAAEAAGVTPKTLYRWMEQPAFKTALGSAEAEALDKTTRRLIQLSSDAIEALESVLHNPSQHGASNKRLAAMAMLDQVVKFRELRSLEERLATLEELTYVRYQSTY